MNKVHFWKYDGAGNDFILLDLRNQELQLTVSQIAQMCHRRFGIGADGLMTLSNTSVVDNDGRSYDFEMKYYNSDGRLGSMCGNGGRCITAFAYNLGMFDNNTRFLGYDGPHGAEILVWDASQNVGIVQLGMKNVLCGDIRRCLDGWFLDTGSPHYVQRVQNLESFDVYGEGKRLRHDAEFPEGTNVDFIEDLPDGRLMVRTYERGVEDETWACGTGVTACAIVSGNRNLVTKGGDFKVSFEATETGYSHVKLTGPVAFNFEGDYGFIQ